MSDQQIEPCAKCGSVEISFAVGKSEIVVRCDKCKMKFYFTIRDASEAAWNAAQTGAAR